ncbi:glutathione S-transferase family protein [Pseudomonas oryzihabitans]|nr:glutathione S-transferase family protein [Pseudomonas psychrotolerans]MDR6355962.1 glutathione S-transferase [Pseudomonas psychrotolerans]MDR6677924.1 glutathione S-transferase [Pseudomonas psychrotolerans]
MSMILYHTPASPFGRKVVVMLHETDLIEQVEVEIVQQTPLNPNRDVLDTNPAGKIPALRLADGTCLHDSRVILDYLDTLHQRPPLIPRQGPERWRRLTLASLCDAMMEAAVQIRYESFMRPPGMQWKLWLDNQQEKIARALDYFERDAIAELEGEFDVACLGMACLLGYLDFRIPTWAWRSDCPRIAAWYARVSERPSLQATRP